MLSTENQLIPALASFSQLLNGALIGNAPDSHCKNLDLNAQGDKIFRTFVWCLVYELVKERVLCVLVVVYRQEC